MQEKSQIFLEMLNKIRPTVYRFLLYKTYDHEIAEDLTQETLVKAFEKLPNYKEKGSFSQWVLAIAKRKFYDWLRESKVLNEPLNDYEVVDTDNTEKLYTQKYMSECIQQQINCLSQKESHILKLKFLQGLSPPQIARQLRCTPGAAKTSLSRAKKKLEKRLGEVCDFYYNDENKLCCTRKEEEATYSNFTTAKSRQRQSKKEARKWA